MPKVQADKAQLVWKAINTSVSHGMSYFEMSGGDWNVFSKTFGWYQVSKDLTPEQIEKVKALFQAKGARIYGKGEQHG